MIPVIPVMSRAIAATAAVGAAVVLLAAPAGAASSGVTVTCPAAQPLTHNATAAAAQAALAEAPGLYQGIDTTGQYVDSSTRAAQAGPRGAQIGLECGQRVEDRSVVVELHFPAMEPSASLSQGIVFVSRIHNHYTVWQLAH